MPLILLANWSEIITIGLIASSLSGIKFVMLHSRHLGSPLHVAVYSEVITPRKLTLPFLSS